MFVKICGINSDEAVVAALEAGADALGFVLAPSVRQVSAERAARLAASIHGRAQTVAVMRSSADIELEQIQSVFVSDRLQIDQCDVASLPMSVRGRALPVFRDNETLPNRLPDCLLFEGSQSGVGQTANWDTARALASRTRLILAGGLHSGNVAEAIRVARPWGVDVSSGVESSPGQKCPQKIYEFVMAARAAFKEMS